MHRLIDFLTHSEKFIEAPPRAIWPFILDTNRWFTQKMSPAGKGQVGERFDVVDQSAPARVLFHMENVELVPHRRRTARLDATDGTFLGYAAWVLRESESRTQVGYHVYCRVPVPEGSSAPDVLADAQRRMDEGFERLKALVERG